MHTHSQYSVKFDLLRCCVLVPTYNNAATLERVLLGVMQFTSQIIVINDGSTDATAEILKRFPQLWVLDLSRNQGKGNALRQGFRKAEELGFDYAISIDSDGQHYPEDLPVFLGALEQRKEQDLPLLVVGSRKMDGPGVPEKSSFGNRLSSLWYWVQTGIRLQDTQCGYRLYPIRLVNSLQLFTSRFELEIEVLVKAALNGARVINLPVRVLYDPAERVTHFRPFTDVVRIVLLNMYLVFYALRIKVSKPIIKRNPPEVSPSSRTKSPRHQVPLE